MDLGLTPCEAAAALRHLPGLCFFDSAGHCAGSPPLSIVAARPRHIRRGHLSAPEGLRDDLERCRVDGPDCGFPLGAACGWVDYDGRFRFAFYDDLLVYAHLCRQWFEVGSLAGELQPLPHPARHDLRHGWAAGFTRAGFLKAVSRAREHIAAGDIYQVNLSQRFERRVAPQDSLFGLYERLRSVSPAPMAAYLDAGEREVLSSSPETFLRMHGRSIQTRPIKGTRPRFADPGRDSRSAFELQTSEKEIAELVMITDLERNDLGRVCEFGSVTVTDLLKLERFEQVHHLVSTVTGQLRADAGHLDALAACFPGGSITGAPKKRAMEIIADLEPVPRGLYTGAIGYLGYNEESQFNIAIRTLVRDGPLLSYSVGAGIVADSLSEMEYRETLQKAEGIRLALGEDTS